MAADHPRTREGNPMNTRLQLIRSLSFFAGFLVVALFADVGWAQSSPPGMPGGDAVPVNATCPVMPGEPIDPRFTVIYEGKSIGLCCRKCRTKFEADPAAYIASLSAPIASPAGIDRDEGGVDRLQDAHDQHDGHAHEHDGAGQPAAAQTENAQAEPDADRPAEHAHSHDTAARSKLAVWIGKFHPASTHLPIGLILGAAVAESLFLLTRKAYFRHAAAFCLTLGTIGALVTALLGWFNGGFVLWDEDWVQATHRWLGTVTAILALLTLVFCVRAVRPVATSRAMLMYRVALFTTAGTLPVAGFFGGALVYGLRHYAM
jgi:uncharacterized membrane protein